MSWKILTLSRILCWVKEQNAKKIARLGTLLVILDIHRTVTLEKKGSLELNEPRAHDYPSAIENDCHHLMHS